MDITVNTTTIDEAFVLDRLKELGFQRREVQIDIARDIDKVLRASAPEPEIVTIRRGTHKNETRHRHQPACGFVQASPGTGKTLAGLVALLLHHKRTGNRVAVSTYTRALQRQILTDGDLARAQALAGVTVQVAVRMGRANFISRERVEWYDRLLHEAGATTPSWDEFVNWVRNWREDTDPMDTTFLAWRDNHESLPIVRGEEVSEELLAVAARAKRKPSAADQTQDNIRQDDAEEAEIDDENDVDQVYYARHAINAQSADLVITNHATVLLHGQSGGHVLGDIGAIIFDEADRLPDAARSLYTHRLRPDLLLKRCERRTGRKSPKRIQEIGAQLTDLMREIGEECQWRDITPHDLSVCQPERFRILGELLSAFRLRGCPQETAGLRDVRKAFGGDSASTLDIVYIGFSPVRRLPAFCIDPDPVDVRDLLSHLVTQFTPVPDAKTNEKKSTLDDADEDVISSTAPLFTHAVYVSASLANLVMADPLAGVHHDYGVSSRSVIVSEQREPPVFGCMSLVLPDPRVPRPFVKQDKENPDARMAYNPEWLDYVCAAIDQDKNRRMLVLTPSFADVMALLERRGIHVDEDAESRSIDHDGVRYHLPADPSHHVARSIDNPAVRAIVTPSLWEGANLVIPGADGQPRLWMNDLIISRLPIPPQGSEYAVERLRNHLMRTRKKIRTVNEANGVIVRIAAAQALRKTIQGIGRGIRGPYDDIRVWLLDPRLELPSEWLEHVQEAIYDQGDEFVYSPDGSIGPAHRYWSRVIPSRFMSQVDQAAIFLNNGTMLDWSVISRGIYA